MAFFFELCDAVAAGSNEGNLDMDLRTISQLLAARMNFEVEQVDKEKIMSEVDHWKRYREGEWLKRTFEIQKKVKEVEDSVIREPLKEDEKITAVESQPVKKKGEETIMKAEVKSRHVSEASRRRYRMKMLKKFKSEN